MLNCGHKSTNFDPLKSFLKSQRNLLSTLQMKFENLAFPLKPPKNWHFMMFPSFKNSLAHSGVHWSLDLLSLYVTVPFTVWSWENLKLTHWPSWFPSYSLWPHFLVCGGIIPVLHDLPFWLNVNKSCSLDADPLAQAVLICSSKFSHVSEICKWYSSYRYKSLRRTNSRI